MGRHRCRLQERDGRPLEAPVLPLAGQGGTRARNEQTRGHLWILLERPLLAKDCRIYIHDLARRLGVPAKGSGLGEGIEIFPRHSAIGEGGFGNAVRGPLGIHRGASRVSGSMGPITRWKRRWLTSTAYANWQKRNCRYSSAAKKRRSRRVSDE